MTISAVGSIATAVASPISVSPVNVGDVLIVGVVVSSTADPFVDTLTGGGVTNWNVAYATSLFDTYVLIGWGEVTSTGPSSISTVVTAPNPGMTFAAAQEFTSSISTPNYHWVQDPGSGTGVMPQSQVITTASGYYTGTVIAGIEPTLSEGLFFGVALLGGVGPVGGTTAGVTYNNYIRPYAGFFQMIWEANVTPFTTYNPDWFQTSAAPTGDIISGIAYTLAENQIVMLV